MSNDPRADDSVADAVIEREGRGGLLRSLAHPAYLGGDRPDHTEVIQCGGTKRVDDRTQICDRLARGLLRPGEERERVAAAGSQPAPHGVEVEPDTGQQRAQAVVEVAAKPAPFFLARLDDALT